MMSLIKGLPICQRDTAKAACWDEFRIHSFVTSLVAFILPSFLPSFLVVEATSDADVKVPSADNPELSKGFSRNLTSHALL